MQTNEATSNVVACRAALHVCRMKKEANKNQQNNCNTIVSSFIQVDASVLKVMCSRSFWKLPGRRKQHWSRDLSLRYVRVYPQTFLRGTILCISSNEIKKPKTTSTKHTNINMPLLSGANLALCAHIKALCKPTNWTSASDKADLLQPASGQQSHHTGEDIQHDKLLKRSPTLEPED